jgi:hypothetical protein
VLITLHRRPLALVALCTAARVPDAAPLPLAQRAPLPLAQRAGRPECLGEQRRAQSGLLRLERGHVARAHVRAPLPRGPLRLGQATQPPRQRDQGRLALAGLGR